MYQQRIGARAEYLQEQRERIKSSSPLAEKFPALKSLSAILVYFAPDGVTRESEIKSTFNLTCAKSLFLFDCPNKECVGGNFDLSSVLSQAVNEQRESAAGETRCQGWQSKTTIGRAYCDHILRYKLNLSY